MIRMDCAVCVAERSETGAAGSVVGMLAIVRRRPGSVFEALCDEHRAMVDRVAQRLFGDEPKL